MKTFKLPDLGEGLAEAEIVEWYVKPGDKVDSDQNLVSVETAKAHVDIPSPHAGVVVKTYGNPGDIIKTGSPLVDFEGENTEPREDAGAIVGKLEASDIVFPTAKPGHVKATPAVRALARQLSVDLQALKASGSDGSVTRQDVLSASGKAECGFEPLKGTRRTMSKTMSSSHASVVPVTIMDEAVLSIEKKKDITLSLIEAIVEAVKLEPALNAWFDGHELARKIHSNIHLGLAVDTEAGLFVPVLPEVETLERSAIRKHINEIKDQVQKRSISVEALQGATFILSNFGNFSGRFATPIVVPPMVAILGAGRLRELTNEQYQLPLSLTFDHRAVTGGEAARFLKAILDALARD